MVAVAHPFAHHAAPVAGNQAIRSLARIVTAVVNEDADIFARLFVEKANHGHIVVTRQVWIGDEMGHLAVFIHAAPRYTGLAFDQAESGDRFTHAILCFQNSFDNHGNHTPCVCFATMFRIDIRSAKCSSSKHLGSRMGMGGAYQNMIRRDASGVVDGMVHGGCQFFRYAAPVQTDHRGFGRPVRKHHRRRMQRRMNRFRQPLWISVSSKVDAQFRGDVAKRKSCLHILNSLLEKDLIHRTKNGPNKIYIFVSSLTIHRVWSFVVNRWLNSFVSVEISIFHNKTAAKNQEIVMERTHPQAAANFIRVPQEILPRPRSSLATIGWETFILRASSACESPAFLRAL